MANSCIRRIEQLRGLVGPVIFRDRGKVAEFAELPTSDGIREIPQKKQNLKKKKKCQSHMAFSCVLAFLLSTHSIDCAVPLLLSIHVLIVPIFFRSPR